MISKKQVEHIAHLARLKLSEKEKEKFSKELSQILDFVEKLNEVDVLGVEPFMAGEIVGVSREDKAVPKSEELVNKLMANVPNKSGRLVKTRKIF